MSNKPKILLTHEASSRATYYGDAAMAILREAGELMLNDTGSPLDAAATIAHARDCTLIVSDRTNVGPAAVFDALPNLVAFCRCAVDHRNVDVAAASRNGVLVTHASPGFVDAVSEMALGFIIDLARGITDAAAAYHAGRMPAVRIGRQLSASTVGVIGYGAIGRRIVALTRAVGMTVLVSDPYQTIEADGVSQVPLTDLLGRSDFVVCAAVATEATENLMNAAAFGAMKPGACFVNISRGNLVDEDALAAALASGRLAGAALDVGRAPDQMPSPAIARLPNVIATPHIGGLTPEATAHQAIESARQAAAILDGRVPEGAVNADAATRLSRLRHG